MRRSRSDWFQQLDQRAMAKVFEHIGIQNGLPATLSGFAAAAWKGLRNRRPLHFLIAFFLFIALLQVGQDFLHAYLHGYKGYLSDSLVFKLYWLMFIPSFTLLLRYATTLGNLTRPARYWFLAIGGALLFSVAHILLVSVLIVAVSHLFFGSPFAFSTPLYYFASEHIYLTLFFYAAGFAYIFLLKKRASSVLITTNTIAIPEQQPDAVPQPDFISVTVQNRQIPIAVENIVCIQSDRPYVRIHTCSGSFLHATTLKDMLAKLSARQFVRIHRSTVVNIAFVDSLKSRANGDYDVAMKHGEDLRMSRNYYPAFKKIMA